ncbi:hypothetical protein [Plantactinospora sonchi]|uniref:Lipoprotein n=1 Tax=Plantactinospora sonchi TaxID=1544735 RepID=A0ABU7S4M9_9ACTN
MQRARRLASIAVIAVLGTTALSACRSEPNVAAYVGDRKITENEVTSVLNDAKSKVPPTSTPTVEAGAPEAGAPPESTVKAPTRGEVVRVLVMEEVCRRLAADKGFQPAQAPPADEWAGQQGLPVGSRYVQHAINLQSCISAAPTGQPVAPSQQDLADLMARGQAAGVMPPEVDVEQVRQRYDGDTLRGGFALRQTLTTAVADYRVKLNPRYGQQEYPLLLLGDAALVVVQIGDEGPDMVVDAR